MSETKESKDTTANTRKRKVGVSTGYETDGVNYWLAPSHVEAWGSTSDQAAALDAIIEATVRTVAEARRHVEAMRRRWWDSVYADLELDKSVQYSFNRLEGKVSPVSTPEEKKE
jgi:siroheme synthase (precorrin-2 oxidase/ferrochelatase)